MARKAAKNGKRETQVMAERREERMSVRTNTAPYSLQSMIRFLSDNAGLLFLALSIFIVGFLAGSMWTENNMLKKGVGTGTGTGTVQNQPITPTAPEAPAAPLSDENWKKVQEGAAGVIGNRNAPLTIVEYTDYQCPFCSRHYQQTYPQIKKEYLDTGKAKLILQDQPLTIHPNARPAALAARCASDQGFLGQKDKNFEAMHDALFGKQEEWSNLSKDAAIAKFGEYAKAAGMNDAQLMECVKTEKFGKDVDASVALGNANGANATPTFFVEKTTVVGAQDFSAFQAALDAAK
jgi:protein-disulfide isomerase